MLFYYNLTFTCAKAPHYELLKKIVLSILPGVLNKFYCENVIISDFIQYLIFIDYFSMIYIFQIRLRVLQSPNTPRSV